MVKRREKEKSPDSGYAETSMPEELLSILIIRRIVELEAEVSVNDRSTEINLDALSYRRYYTIHQK